MQRQAFLILAWSFTLEISTPSVTVEPLDATQFLCIPFRYWDGKMLN